MSRDEAQRRRTTAAEPTMQRIRRDRERVSHQLKPLLGYLEEHLFDGQLTAEGMMRACGVADNMVRTLFTSEVGLSPWQYVTDCRLEIAARMLLGSRLPAWHVGKSLGYPRLDGFSRAFHRWSGQRPTEYRKQPQKRPREGPPHPPVAVREEEQEAACAARLAAPDAEGVLHRLRAICSRIEQVYPGLGPPPAAVHKPLPGAELMERVAAEVLWQKIADLDWDHQRFLVRSQFHFHTPALFELLCRKSREEGRRCRQRGVQLAKLARDSLEAIPENAGLHLANLRARAWAWIGNAQRLALDLGAAENAFAIAEAEIDLIAQPQRDPRAVGEVLQHKAALRLYQRRFSEALALGNRAVECFRRHGDSRLLADSLVGRGNSAYYSGDLEGAIRDLTEADKLTVGHADTFLRLTISRNLANAYAGAGDFAAARKVLAPAIPLCEELGDARLRYHFYWTEGYVYFGLGDYQLVESCYQAARRGFSRLGDSAHVAACSLDLAVLYSKQQRLPELFEVAAEVVPLLETVELNQEMITGINLLRKALKVHSLPSALLEKVKSRLENYVDDPRVGFGQE